jgi:hypothetical protein
MRAAISLALSAVTLLAACSKGENAGADEAKKAAEAEQKAKESRGEPAKKIAPPVPGEAHIPCEQLIDLPKYQEAMGETEAMAIKDVGKNEPEAAASCSLVRGGKKLTDAEQQAKLKKDGRLGVLPGDEICNVSTFCWTIEDPDRFRKKCAEMKEKDDDTLGFYSCVLVVAQGADDVKRFRFFDDDTKCIIQVRGGPSNVDNDIIGKCAKTAHDLIGPDEIKPGPPPAPEAPAAAGSGSGS